MHTLISLEVITAPGLKWVGLGNYLIECSAKILKCACNTRSDSIMQP